MAVRRDRCRARRAGVTLTASGSRAICGHPSIEFASIKRVRSSSRASSRASSSEVMRPKLPSPSGCASEVTRSDAWGRSTLDTQFILKSATTDPGCRGYREIRGGVVLRLNTRLRSAREMVCGDRGRLAGVVESPHQILSRREAADR